VNYRKEFVMCVEGYMIGNFVMNHSYYLGVKFMSNTSLPTNDPEDLVTKGLKKLVIQVDVQMMQIKF
jgi:hypothetical protein